MDFDHEESRRRREYQDARAKLKKQEQKLAELKRATTSAKNRLLSSTRSEQWHRMSLAWLERRAGYTGEMSAARVWLRHQPMEAYIMLVGPYVSQVANGPNIDVEIAAVRANLEGWTRKGESFLLERAKREYAGEMASFREWQQNNPGNERWRTKKPTSAQGFLIARMAVALDVSPPARLNRGSAYDWIQAHGGNPRLSADVSREPTDTHAMPGDEESGR